MPGLIRVSWLGLWYLFFGLYLGLQADIDPALLSLLDARMGKAGHVGSSLKATLGKKIKKGGSGLPVISKTWVVAPMDHRCRHWCTERCVPFFPASTSSTSSPLLSY